MDHHPNRKCKVSKDMSKDNLEVRFEDPFREEVVERAVCRYIGVLPDAAVDENCDSAWSIPLS